MENVKPTKKWNFSYADNKGGMKRGQKQVRTIIRQELGVTVEDQLKTLGLFIKGAGAVRLIKQMQTLTGFRYVMAWQIVAEYIMPKLSRAEVELTAKEPTTINNLIAVLPTTDKLKLLEILRNNKVAGELQSSIQETSVNATDIAHEEVINYDFLD